MKRTQFNEKQLFVINDTQLLENLYNTLLEIAINEELDTRIKRITMFRELVNYMRLRKGDFLIVGIKKNVADNLVRNELKTLSDLTKDVKDVIS